LSEEGEIHGHVLAYDRRHDPDFVVLFHQLDARTQRGCGGKAPRHRGSNALDRVGHGFPRDRSGCRSGSHDRPEAVHGSRVRHHGRTGGGLHLGHVALCREAHRAVLLPRHAVPEGTRRCGRNARPTSPGLRAHPESAVITTEQKV